MKFLKSCAGLIQKRSRFARELSARFIAKRNRQDVDLSRCDPQVYLLDHLKRLRCPDCGRQWRHFPVERCPGNVLAASQCAHCGVRVDFLRIPSNSYEVYVSVPAKEFAEVPECLPIFTIPSDTLPAWPQYFKKQYRQSMDFVWRFLDGRRLRSVLRYVFRNVVRELGLESCANKEKAWKRC
jgi:ribosomal protein S27AE